MNYNNVMEALAGREFDFYGVCDHCFKLNGKVFEAVEDPSDGYRSYLETVMVVDDTGGIFFPQPVARVKVEAYEDGFCLKRVEDNADVLRVFTDDYDSYYPMFRFEYVLPNAPRLPFREESKYDALAALLD